MKKLLLLILSLSMATVAFSSCSFIDDLLDPVDSSSPTSSVEAPSSEKEEKVYKVTFVQNGLVVKTIEVKEGGAVAESDIPALTEKTGYTVTWEDVSLKNITANIEVKAVEKANTYEITYNANGGAGVPATPQKVLYDSEVTLHTPTREGYNFKYWLTEDGKILESGKWKIASNVTLTAEWEPVVVKTCTVTFQTVEGVLIGEPKTVTAGETLTDIPAFPTDAGYTYAWDVTDFSNITSDMTVTLIATAKEFTITYNAGEGATIEGATTQTVVYNQEYTLTPPTVTKDGFDFGGWVPEGEVERPLNVWTYAGNMTLNAVWNEVIPDTYTITFITEKGEQYDTRTVTAGETLTNIPAFPTDAGYTYAWDVTDFSNITSDMTVTLIATAKQFTITFNAGEGATLVGQATQMVVYNEEYSLIGTTAIKDGWTFAGWVPASGELPADRWTLPDNMTLNATWTKKAVHTITFVQNGQSPVTRTVVDGEDLTDIPDPVAKPGYTVEWKAEDLAKLTNVTGSFSVNATETANTYTITYTDAKGVFENTTVTYDEGYTLTQSSTVVGYHVAKFTLGDGTEIAASGTWNIADNVMITVHWAADTYKVTLNANGGTCSKTEITVTYGEAYSLPTDLTKASHVFEGWKLNGTLIANTGTWTYTTAGDFELIASWQSEEWTKNY